MKAGDLVVGKSRLTSTGVRYEPIDGAIGIVIWTEKMGRIAGVLYRDRIHTYLDTELEVVSDSADMVAHD
jgi:hypothetical protein